MELFIDKKICLSWYCSFVSKTVEGVLMWIFMVYPPSIAVLRLRLTIGDHWFERTVGAHWREVTGPTQH